MNDKTLKKTSDTFLKEHIETRNWVESSNICHSVRPSPSVTVISQRGLGRYIVD